MDGVKEFSRDKNEKNIKSGMMAKALKKKKSDWRHGIIILQLK